MTTQHSDEISILRELVHLSPGHIYWKDINLIYRGVNENMGRFHELNDCSDLIGLTDDQTLSLLGHEQKADDINKNDALVITTQQVIVVEEDVIDLDGNITHFLSYKKPMFDLHHNVSGVMGVSIDITAQKHAAEQLRLAHEKMQRNNRLKSELISNLRHDVRSPFSGIHGLLEILQCEETNESKQQLIIMCLASLKSLMSYCDDTLKASMDLDQDIPTMTKNFSPATMIERLSNTFRVSAHKKKLGFSCAFDDNVPTSLIGPYEALFRILTNLLDNAIKFTDQGYVHIQIGYRDRDLCIDVSDTGVGIEPENRQAVFTKFYKLSSQSQRKTEGFGLGLYFVANLCKNNNMEITIRDNGSQGLIFNLLCPCQETK